MRDPRSERQEVSLVDVRHERVAEVSLAPPPPKVDPWGPGSRVPAIVISPFARQGYVDSTVYETTSITALIEHRWALPPLGTRDANDADLSNAFDFGP
jgi:phospholipase C